MGLPSSPWFRRPRFILGAFVLLVLLGWVGFFVWETVQSMSLIRSGKIGAGANSPSFESSVKRLFAGSIVNPDDVTRLDHGTHPTLGNPKAPVHIVEFVDYGCPYCQKEATTLRSFMSRHMDDVELVIRDFPVTDLHPKAKDAAAAADCVFVQGNPDRYWRFSDLLFASQTAETTSELRTDAERLGANMNAYDACIKDPKTASGIQASIEDGQAMGVQGTPTFFFNGVKIQGDIDAESLEIVGREAATHVMSN
jgi:protein-disulfide isomerase